MDEDKKIITDAKKAYLDIKDIDTQDAIFAKQALIGVLEEYLCYNYGIFIGFPSPDLGKMFRGKKGFLNTRIEQLFAEIANFSEIRKNINLN